MKVGTIALSWGEWGGFYLHWRKGGITKRLCLGWVAITYVRVEIDDLMRAYCLPNEVAGRLEADAEEMVDLAQNAADEGVRQFESGRIRGHREASALLRRADQIGELP